MFDSEVNSGFTQTEEINISNQFSEIELLHASTNGYTQVYRAKRFGKWHVLKCLTKDAQKIPTYQTLLEKEFTIGYSISHPNIIRTIGFELVEGLGQCIVLEYIDGKIPDRLDRAQVVELCQAVSYLHHEGIIHRDIKPENILVAKDSGKLYLLDLGLADRFDFAVLKGAAGTTKYAAPEQLNEGAVNPQTDIYGIGVVLSLLSSFSHIARKCRRTNPQDRYQSVDSIIRRLNHKYWNYIVGGFFAVLFIAALSLLYKTHVTQSKTQAAQLEMQKSQQIIDSLQIKNYILAEKAVHDSIQIDSLSNQVVNLKDNIINLQGQTIVLQDQTKILEQRNSELQNVLERYFNSGGDFRSLPPSYQGANSQR